MEDFMASGDSLKKLFKSFKQLDNEGFYSAAFELINQEKQKKHNVLARDLQKILENGNEKSVSSAHLVDFQKMPKDHERGTLLFELRSADRYLDDIVLNDDVREQVDNIIREFSASEILRTYGLSPRRKLLFAGPPGCGKTLCANVVAAELGLPLLYTRFDAVISSYLGETAANLRKVFDFAETGTWVVFFDEFDAIGKSRDDLSEHGELKRVVNTFLQLLDSFKSDSIFIAATNHEALLDNALWRRFDDILYFDKPSIDQIKKLLKLKLVSVNHRKLSLETFAAKMIGFSHSDVERVCFDAIKISILNDESEITNSTFNQALYSQTRRSKLIKKNQRK
jgi:SpoVK/Ycf46/Vps4 family AAA+-type ATPase